MNKNTTLELAQKLVNEINEKFNVESLSDTSLEDVILSNLTETTDSTIKHELLFSHRNKYCNCFVKKANNK